MKDLAEQLQALGCPAVCGVNIGDVIEGGPKNVVFTQVVSWLSHQLQVLNDLESCINPINDPEDSSNFLLEVSSFLRELSCPHSCLTEGTVSQRLVPLENKELLLEYLCSELQAAKILSSKLSSTSNAMTVEMQESSTAKELKEMLISLNFSKPPPTITSLQLFSKVESRLNELLNQHKLFSAIEPLFTGTLTERQWFQLESLWTEMSGEYSARREMLLTRLDVTVQSFTWSDRLKNVDDKIARIYTPFRNALTNKPSVCVSDVLAARKDLLSVEATSSGSARENTKSSVNRVLIGSVPDRGGRPEDQQPPPPEVPSWQMNQPSRSGFGDQRRGADRNDRGGRARGGGGGSSYNSGEQSNRSSSHSSGEQSGRSTSYSSGELAGRSDGNFSRDRVHSYRAGRPRGGGNIIRGGGDGFGPNNDIIYVAQGADAPHMEQGVRMLRYLNDRDRGAGDFHRMGDQYPGPFVPNPGLPSPHGVHSFTPYGDEPFGVGIGGYAATGGNFQQYGMTINQPGNRGGHRGGRPGRNPRGPRRGGYNIGGY